MRKLIPKHDIPVSLVNQNSSYSSNMTMMRLYMLNRFKVLPTTFIYFDTEYINIDFLKQLLKEK